MKIEFRVILDDGKTYHGEAVLTAEAAKKPMAKSAVTPAPATQESVDFSLPIRPFFKRYASGKSGAQKFSILTAYLCKGKSDATVTLQALEENWNRMTALMGGEFNRAHSTRAKDAGWIDSPKAGQYTIRPSWISCL
jgi:hypothetical protein